MDDNEEEAVKRREQKIINSLCSFQNRLGPPEYRRWRRVHGLQLPLHPQQVIAWIVMLTIAAVTFFVLIPSLSTSFRECLLIVLSVLFGVHILSHMTALLLDPADPELRALKVKVVVPEFDRTKRAHVIENGHCYLCNINIKGPRTKHCSICNKCVDQFDHHCKWLNHCIGGRNYAAFFVCVITAVAASFLVVVLSILEIVYYHTDSDSLNIYPEGHNGTTSSFNVRGYVFIGVAYILAILALATGGLLLHLCLFHCYISYRGITTYEYIRSYQQGVVPSTFVRHGVTCKRTQVMSNHISSSDEMQNNRCFSIESCHLRSRPRENEEYDINRPVYFLQYFCTRFGLCNSDSDGVGSPKEKTRKLERQDTDPEFVDRMVKPFVITLSDEKKGETAEGNVTNCCAISPAKISCCSLLKNNTDGTVGVDNSDKTPEPLNEPIQKVLKLSRTDSVSSSISKRDSRAGKCWQFCSENMDKSSQMRNTTDTLSKIKSNQIRPKAEEEGNKTHGKIVTVKSENKMDILHPDGSPSFDNANKLPELSAQARKVQNSSELKEITTVLDFAEQPNFALQRSMRSNLYRGRKKIFSRRPRSPSLSPIRESGLSNPGSPRVNAISPLSTPILTRTSSPEMSTIFLSNPNSPYSSDDELSSPPPTPHLMKRNSGDILETPQLPRKLYSAKDPVLIVKPNNVGSGKCVDIENGDDV